MLSALIFLSSALALSSASHYATDSYGLPLERVTQQRFGVPELQPFKSEEIPATFSQPEPVLRLPINDFSALPKVYGPPANVYGPPTKVVKVETPVPKIVYGLPAVEKPFPLLPLNVYGIPVVPAQVYSTPAKVYLPPTTVYGPPAIPTKIYGPPATVYGPPARFLTPGPINRLPKIATTVYQKPTIVYGPPAVPAKVYGPPKIPSATYGTPVFQVPEPIYGLPHF